MLVGRRVLIVCCLLLSFNLCGCFSFFRHSGAKDITGAAPYSGLKAKIVVAGFEDKTGKVTAEVATSLRDILVNTLIKGNRFLVVDRQAPGADFIVSVEITEFNPDISGGKSGVGGGGAASSGMFGGLMPTVLNKASIALDIRTVNAVTSEVLSTKLVQAQASDTTGVVMSSANGNPVWNNGLSVYAHTPMEKAIRLSIIEAERYIIQSTPESYYKYKN